MSFIQLFLEFLLQKSMARCLIKHSPLLLAGVIWMSEKWMPGFLDDWLGYHLYRVFLKNVGKNPVSNSSTLVETGIEHP